MKSPQKQIDDHQYWKERHGDLNNSIAAVGTKSYSERANRYSYAILIEQYKKILDQLDLKKGESVLDAGSGIGIFSDFLADRGYQVTAVDVSDLALRRIKNPAVRKEVSTLAKLSFPEKPFSLVHCFDVLYHILDDEEWKKSLTALCRCSKKYVVLHERFLKKPQIVSSKHVRQRIQSETFAELEKHGFYEVLSIPTHVLSLRLWSYRFSRFFPGAFYAVDRFLLDRIERTKWKSLGSHHIKVFEFKN